MNVKGLLIATVLLVAGMTAFAFWVAAGLPKGAELPTHWNSAGGVDDTMPALQALLLPAAIALGLGLINAVIPALEPLQQKLEGSAPVLRVAWIALMLVLVLVQVMIAAPALGWQVGPSVLVAAAGAMLIAIGNVLPKSRPGFFVGIRTPWTISNTDVWIATHRLGGKLMMLAGLIILAAALSPIDGGLRDAVVVAAALGAAIVPIGYSWWLWRQERRRA